MVKRLVLHARDPEHALGSRQDLHGVLVATGLIGVAIKGTEGGYHAGESFLSLISFLGCSPHIDFVPADEAASQQGRFCHVRLQGPSPTLSFRRDTGPLQPRCGKCRADVPDWRVRVEEFLIQGEGEYRCKKCALSSAISALNWRQSAGFGRWFVEIWNIHPHEAVPSEHLFGALEQALGTKMSFFYQ